MTSSQTVTIIEELFFKELETILIPELEKVQIRNAFRLAAIEAMTIDIKQRQYEA